MTTTRCGVGYPIHGRCSLVRGLCRSAAAERDILIFICSGRSGEGGSSLGSGGGVTSLSVEGRGGRSGISFCFSSVAVCLDDGSGREGQGRLSLSTTLFLFADFNLMGLAGGDGRLAGVCGDGDSSAARALLLVGMRSHDFCCRLGWRGGHHDGRDIFLLHGSRWRARGTVRWLGRARRPKRPPPPTMSTTESPSVVDIVGGGRLGPVAAGDHRCPVGLWCRR